MPRYAITALVVTDRISILLAMRKLRNELRKPRNRRILELEDLQCSELKE